jgi:hypothetical protein
VSGKSERQQARQIVAEYQEASLRQLVAHVGVAIDRFRGGELDAFEVDHDHGYGGNDAESHPDPSATPSSDSSGHRWCRASDVASTSHAT